MARILIVEDEDKLRGALLRGLAEEGYDAAACEDGEAGLAAAMGGEFDCVVLDVMLPRRDGIDVLRALREAGSRTPVLLLTARGEVEDRVRGLDAGADDYLTKPFAWAELLARLRVCLRRREDAADPALHAAGLDLDRVRRRVSAAGQHAELTDRECALLEYFMRRPGRVIGRDELARDVWKDPQAGLTNVIDVYVNYLRKKLEKVGAGGRIRTVRGAGYELRG
ncbi:Transcriptional regulatory protein TcrA [Aquisphaera giovannonii]|uniref:Transcriptional regulatory protein TcrA n=1 Tax=Aquisphaera giovannonii TaxID=406548 RepID=A0A5B9W6B7_9BACT|nr:response regulator transcription factor [Aquisphaera giovannonii]QEH36202.1 Transcriptional regulatory protein TcrA [Aquisphaera giovannonii]